MRDYDFMHVDVQSWVERSDKGCTARRALADEQEPKGTEVSSRRTLVFGLAGSLGGPQPKRVHSYWHLSDDPTCHPSSALQCPHLLHQCHDPRDPGARSLGFCPHNE